MVAEIESTQIIVVLAYLIVVIYLGFLGYMRTKSASDYLIAGRQIHPFVMALSYGATFISTSAIVGFGGVAGLFGMSVLWLTFLNIFVGIFIAFVFFAPRARRMGHYLDAHTFPEFRRRPHRRQCFCGEGLCNPLPHSPDDFQYHYCGLCNRRRPERGDVFGCPAGIYYVRWDAAAVDLHLCESGRDCPGT